MKEKVTFAEIFEQNKRRINYHTRVSQLGEPQQESFHECLFATWHAYKKYQPDKGLLATYFNYIIRNNEQTSKREKLNRLKSDKMLEGGITYPSETVSDQMKVAEALLPMTDTWHSKKLFRYPNNLLLR